MSSDQPISSSSPRPYDLAKLSIDGSVGLEPEALGVGAGLIALIFVHS